MGTIHTPERVLPITAVFTHYPEAIEWAKEKIKANWGEITLESEAFPFEQTKYYDASMGEHLKKIFFAINPLMDPAKLVEMKNQSNLWEEEFARTFAQKYPESEVRPLNIDPGYITLGKLVLASSKDFYHRIYIGDGIYAEITLSFSHEKWRDFPWTFPDYKEETYHPFFEKCRGLIFQENRKQKAENRMKNLKKTDEISEKKPK